LDGNSCAEVMSRLQRKKTHRHIGMDESAACAKNRAALRARSLVGSILKRRIAKFQGIAIP
jgi:hypothetical protein